MFIFNEFNFRSGVEDTRLEAKVKDTKKFKAKGHLSDDRPSQYQGQECSRPWTKDTTQEYSPKKRSFRSKKLLSFHKIQAISKKRKERSLLKNNLKFSAKF